MNINLENSIITQRDSGELAARMLQKFISREDQVGQGVKPVSIKVTGKDETLKRLEKHLSGELRTGVYNLLPDGTVRWAVVEFENHGPGAVANPREAVKRYRSALKEKGVQSYIERSKSLDEENYHLWIFFEQGIEAYRVHRSLKALLTVEGLNPDCEVFPKTDKENPEGIGNFVWLPYFGRAEDVISGSGGEAKRGGGVPSERTVFIDDDGNPLADATMFLDAIHSVSPEQFADFERAILPYMHGSQDKRVDTKGNSKQLQRVVDHCPFIQYCIEHGDNLSEPLWYPMILNLCMFEGGTQLIHEISSKDKTPGRYSRANTDAKIGHAMDVLERGIRPTTYATIKTLGWPGEVPTWPASPCGWAWYADLEGTLERLKALKGADRQNALRQHFAEDFHYISVNRQAEWLSTLAQGLSIRVEDLERMARATLREIDLAGRELKEMLARHAMLGCSSEEKGTVIFDWFVKNGGLVYRDREHRGFWIWNGTVYEIGDNQPFHTFIWDIAGITHEGLDSKKIWAVLKAETDTKGVFLKSYTWLHTDGSKNIIYIHLNLEDGHILRIDQNGIESVDNGANEDSVLLAPAAKMSPVSFISLDERGYHEALTAFDALVLRNMACVRNDQLLYGCWILTYPLIDYVKTLPHMRCEGNTSSGKTRGMELVSHFVYGDNALKKATVAANYSDGARNPLVLLDNVETDNFDQGLSDFNLMATTGITKEKRRLGTDQDTVLEKVHCLLNTNGIENLGKTEHINRMFAIKFDRWKYRSVGWSERIYAKITAERPRLLSAHMILVSRVLKKIADGKMEWWQEYLETNHPGHSKDRSNSFIALMALILEELLPAIGPAMDPQEIVSNWVESQDKHGRQTASESNPIVGFLEAILEDARRGPFEVSDDFQHWGYEVRCSGDIITGTAAQLHRTFAAAAKRKGLKYEFKDPRQLSLRIADTVKSMAVDDQGDVMVTPRFTLTMTKDRTKTIIYKFDFNPCETAGDEEPTCTLPAVLPADLELENTSS